MIDSVSHATRFGDALIARKGWEVVLGFGVGLFKLYSRASNGNDYSTLLFATAPAQ